MHFLSRSRSLCFPQLPEVQLFVVDFQDIRDKEVEEAKEFLDEESLERAKRNIFKENQNKSILTHAILRYYLEAFTKQPAAKIKILRTPRGKPYMANFPIHFNLSHTSQYALLGFHPYSPIGVDIEQMRNDLDFSKIADLFMHPSEKEKMDLNKNPIDNFFNLWCAKEALLKAKDGSFAELPLLYLDTTDNNQFISKPYEIRVYSQCIELHKLAICHSILD